MFKKKKSKFQNKKVFSEFGEIDRVRIVKDRDTGSSKGFGYVDFYDIENAKAAMENVFFFIFSFFFFHFSILSLSN